MVTLATPMWMDVFLCYWLVLQQIAILFTAEKKDIVLWELMVTIFLELTER